jgi:hypothetical protein
MREQLNPDEQGEEQQILIKISASVRRTIMVWKQLGSRRTQPSGAGQALTGPAREYSTHIYEKMARLELRPAGEFLLQ